ncbi:hypothetical protein ACVWXN_010604 [Bradyrhizobium sp. i1.4.4]
MASSTIGLRLRTRRISSLRRLDGSWLITLAAQDGLTLDRISAAVCGCSLERYVASEFSDTDETRSHTDRLELPSRSDMIAETWSAGSTSPSTASRPPMVPRMLAPIENC